MPVPYSGTEFGATRKIEGQVYKLLEVYGRKSGAEAHKEKAKKKYKNVRVIVGGTGMQKGYGVYAR